MKKYSYSYYCESLEFEYEGESIYKCRCEELDLLGDIESELMEQGIIPSEENLETEIKRLTCIA